MEENQIEPGSNNESNSLEQQLETMPGGQGFFSRLKSFGAGMDIRMHIMEKNGKFTLSILPHASDKSSIQPVYLTGTPEELDNGIFEKLGPVIQEAGLKMIKADPPAKAESPSSSAKKSEPKKETKKAEKAKPEKAAKKAEQPKPEDKPKVEEPSLF